MGILGNDKYEQAIIKLKEREPTIENLNLLLDMAVNVRNDL